MYATVLASFANDVLVVLISDSVDNLRAPLLSGEEAPVTR
jgi:hypothetical protein